MAHPAGSDAGSVAGRSGRGEVISLMQTVGEIVRQPQSFMERLEGFLPATQPAEPTKTSPVSPPKKRSSLSSLPSFPLGSLAEEVPASSSAEESPETEESERSVERGPVARMGDRVTNLITGALDNIGLGSQTTPEKAESPPRPSLSVAPPPPPPPPRLEEKRRSSTDKDIRPSVFSQVSTYAPTQMFRQSVAAREEADEPSMSSSEAEGETETGVFQLRRFLPQQLFAAALTAKDSFPSLPELKNVAERDESLSSASFTPSSERQTRAAKAQASRPTSPPVRVPPLKLHTRGTAPKDEKISPIKTVIRAKEQVSPPRPITKAAASTAKEQLAPAESATAEEPSGMPSRTQSVPFKTGRSRESLQSQHRYYTAKSPTSLTDRDRRLSGRRRMTADPPAHLTSMHAMSFKTYTDEAPIMADEAFESLPSSEATSHQPLEVETKEEAAIDHQAELVSESASDTRREIIQAPASSEQQAPPVGPIPPRKDVWLPEAKTEKIDEAPPALPIHSRPTDDGVAARVEKEAGKEVNEAAPEDAEAKFSDQVVAVGESERERAEDTDEAPQQLEEPQPAVKAASLIPLVVEQDLQTGTKDVAEVPEQHQSDKAEYTDEVPQQPEGPPPAADAAFAPIAAAAIPAKAEPVLEVERKGSADVLETRGDLRAALPLPPPSPPESEASHEGDKSVAAEERSGSDDSVPPPPQPAPYAQEPIEVAAAPAAHPPRLPSPSASPSSSIETSSRRSLPSQSRRPPPLPPPAPPQAPDEAVSLSSHGSLSMQDEGDSG
ncbi:unnamed protein product [Vitrella brassicaformis CCMP3155]|uniref:Uncharacterized protein n=1 Tax=Vitrella brassicaformis (strain CCMP3155) TaxID=1169540 RepID=A0A0G4EVB6_VITBC|nr:unnamed protein product [Vitrella brassicaformis CCMP3155]|eukprot:CEM02336.1 unnamed protein product [Vitrella brassicaformis CCMP3155]